jgi:hypothetical protein
MKINPADLNDLKGQKRTYDFSEASGSCPQLHSQEEAHRASQAMATNHKAPVVAAMDGFPWWHGCDTYPLKTHLKPVFLCHHPAFLH